MELLLTAHPFFQKSTKDFFKKNSTILPKNFHSQPLILPGQLTKTAPLYTKPILDSFGMMIYRTS